MNSSTEKKTGEPVIVERTIDAPIEKVWRAITEKDLMKEWYFDVPAFKPEAGCEFTFDAGPQDRLYTHLCKVIEVIPKKKLKHSWAFKGHEGYSEVTWELTSLQGKTVVKLTHTGLETFPPIADFKKENFNSGWTEIVGKMLPDFVSKL